MEEFELVFDEENIHGVYGISLVGVPATDVQHIYFAKEKLMDWKMASEDKRIVISAVLIPEQRIYRNEIGVDKVPGYTYMTTETISKLQQNFFKQNFNHNSSLEHKQPITDVYFFESWIVENPEMDKSTHLGFNVPKGTWMVAMKIENDVIWNEYIKTGIIGGLSIDALLRPKNIKENNNKNKITFKKMNKTKINKMVLQAIQRVRMASQEFKIDETLSIYANELALGEIITDVDGVALANYEIDYEGMTYVTDDMGVITEIKPIETEESGVEIEVELADELSGATGTTEVLLVDELSGTTGTTEVALAEELSGATGTTEVVLSEEEKLKMVDELSGATGTTEVAMAELVDPTEMLATIAELEAKLALVEEENAKLKADVVLKENEVIAMSNQKPASTGIVDRPTINVSFAKNETTLDAISRITKK